MNTKTITVTDPGNGRSMADWLQSHIDKVGIEQVRLEWAEIQKQFIAPSTDVKEEKGEGSVEQAAHEFSINSPDGDGTVSMFEVNAFIAGAQWQQAHTERSNQELLELIRDFRQYIIADEDTPARTNLMLRALDALSPTKPPIV